MKNINRYLINKILFKKFFIHNYYLLVSNYLFSGQDCGA